MTARLTPDEDLLLRRLHFFEQLGAQLGPVHRAVKDEIRSRDRRAHIRPPEDPLSPASVRAAAAPVKVEGGYFVRRAS